MDKIVMISSDMERNNDLLQCLKVLFPECVIESVTPKIVKGSKLFLNTGDNLSMQGIDE